MARRILFIVIPLFILLLVWVGWRIQQVYFPPKAIHYHAGFIVVKDNKIIDFSGNQYMHEKPCGDDSHEESTPEEDQIDKAHLHDHVGDVVHVHREGAQWKDLFINIKYPLDLTKATVYSNKEKITDVTNFPIMPYESVVIFLGKNDEKKFFDKMVSKKHIEEVEKKSETCGT